MTSNPIFTFCALLGLCLTGLTQAAVITVNSSDVFIQDDGLCTLPEAVLAANQNMSSGQQLGECQAGSAGVDSLSFSAISWPATITLSSVNLPVVTEPLVITGPGVDDLTLVGAGVVPIFETQADLNISGLSVIKGGDYGAGIRVTQAVDLTLSDCAFKQHDASNGGGVIDFKGNDQLHQINITNCLWSDNNLNNGAGAVLHINANSQSNVRVDIMIESSQFIDNTSTGHGGVIALSRNNSSVVNLSVYDSAFVNNASGFKGGVLFANFPGGEVIFERSLFHLNQAGQSGGAIYLGTGAMQLTNNSFHQNQAGDNGGAIYARAFNADEVTLINNTLTENTANTNNSASTGGGLWSDNQVYLGRNILAENVVNGSQSGADCWGDAVSEGHNLVGDIHGCQLQTMISDRLGNSQTTGVINPLLSALADHGGLTDTQQPMVNSPVVDYVPVSDCLDVNGSHLLLDQRQFVRPADGDSNGTDLCDIGAVELNALSDLIFANGFE
jgi:predicted outer membrane repeat protein